MHLFSGILTFTQGINHTNWMTTAKWDDYGLTEA